MMLYKNMKEKVHSSDADIDVFDIDSEILQEDTSAPYFLIFCLDSNFYWSNKRKWFHIDKNKKQKISRRNYDKRRRRRWSTTLYK